MSLMIGVMGMNNELYHHGVKGMKWGVRHDYRVNKVNARRQNNGASSIKRRSTAKKVAIGVAVVGAILVTGYAVHRVNPGTIRKGVSVVRKLGRSKKLSKKAVPIHKVSVDISKSTAKNYIPRTPVPKTTVSKTPVSKVSVDISKSTAKNYIPRTGSTTKASEVDLYTQELLKKNQERLRRYGY